MVPASLLAIISTIHATSLNLREPRIVGGVPSTGYPAFGSPAGNPDCGCTLIHENIALSAAHCLGSFIGRRIYFGGTIIDGQDALGVAVAVGEYPTSDFDYNNFNNDIMLIQLDRAVENVTPAKWNADPSQPVENEVVATMGYGDTHPRRGQPSNILLQVQIPVVSTDECNDAEIYDNLINGDTMICAGSFREDACRGDSGNPLVNEDGVVVGIVSWGFRCGGAVHPGVYTRVSTFDDYIREGVCALAVNAPCYCDNSCVDIPVDVSPIQLPDPTAAPPSDPSSQTPPTLPPFFQSATPITIIDPPIVIEPIQLSPPPTLPSPPPPTPISIIDPQDPASDRASSSSRGGYRQVGLVVVLLISLLLGTS